MMKRLIYFIFAYCILILSAFAVKGEYADKDFDLKSSCVLNFFIVENGKSLKGTCTASFLGNKSFITAEHCHDVLNTNFSQASKAGGPELPTVTCAPDSPIKLTRSDSINRLGLEHSQDIALFKTERDPKVAPIKVAKTTEEIDELMTNSECYINGYGLDNDDKYGVLRAARVKNYEAKALSPFGYNNPFIFQIGGGNSAHHGDSGGPSYCLDKEGKPVLTGIIQGNNVGSLKSKLERVSQAKNIIEYYTNTSSPDMDLLKEAHTTSRMCGYVEKCVSVLKETGDLTSQVGLIITALVKKNGENFSKLVSGQNIELESFEKTWQELRAFYDKQGCSDK